MYGRQTTSSAVNATIQAPQAQLLNASSRLSPGDAIRNSSRGRTPAQNSMAKAMPMNTMALPRSGCLSTSRNGTPTIRPGTSRSRSERGGSFRLDRYRASISTVATLASSDGWPIWCPPIESQLWLLCAVPAPGARPPARRRAAARLNAVERRRQPLEQPERDVEHDPAGHDRRCRTRRTGGTTRRPRGSARRSARPSRA